MAHFGLLQDCQSYFQQAQASWDKYFSKWESLAKEEDVEDKDNLLPDSEVENVSKPTRRVSTARQLCKKSMNILNGKRLKTGQQRKTKWKRERVHRGKARDRKRETEIIHTTENQTNLECEVLNNKHFEADLKAIFIEILSENTNKTRMFSVLSRTFSGTGETISNFSLSSMIMEKNGFSISPVSKTVLHSAFRNEFPLGGNPRGEISDALRRSCVNVTERHASDVHILRTGHLLNLNDTTPHTNSLSLRGHRLVANDVTHCNVKCHESVKQPIQISKTPDEWNCKKDFYSTDFLSPDKTLRKISQTPSTDGNVRRKCSTDKVKRKRARNKFFLESSDEDSEEERIGSSPGRFLKIFCTPKRSRRSIKQDESELETGKEEDDDDCFRILDRVKKDK